MRFSRNRPACITYQLPNPNILLLETKCNDSKILKGYTFPPLSSLGSVLVNSGRKGAICTCNDTSMTKPSKVPDPTKNVSRESNFADKNQKSFGIFLLYLRRSC